MDVDKMNRDALRKYAKDHKIAGYSKLNVTELREVVRMNYAFRTPDRGGVNLADVESSCELSEMAVRERMSRSALAAANIYPTGPLGTYCNNPQWAQGLTR